MVDFKAMAEKSRLKREAEAMSKSVSPDGKTTITSGINSTTEEPGTTTVNRDETTAAAHRVAGALAETAKAALPAEKFFAPDEIEGMAGSGQENVKVTDTLLPRLAILQSLSPQLKEKKVEYIPGAALGDWCDVSVGEVFKEGIDVIPCHFSTQYLQWKKNRGGFAGNLGMDANCLKETTLNEKRQNVLPNGDVIAETATWFVLLRVGYEWRRCFLPFSSTGLKVSRKWLSILRAEKLLGKSGLFTPPLFYRPWHLGVKEETNDQGDWYTAFPSKIERAAEEITAQQPDKYKTIYHMMHEMDDISKWLLREAQQFYVDARDNLVVGDMGNEDMNDPANAKVVNNTKSLTDQSQQM
jgi:hypothetical protein